MRVQQSSDVVSSELNRQEFTYYLLRIGESRESTFVNPATTIDDYIRVYPMWAIDQCDINALIATTYPELGSCYQDHNYMVKRAILTPQNKDVDKINNQLTS